MPETRPFEISVIVCAHNPRQGHWVRTLDSLRRQTQPLDAWELVVVDNNSSPPLEQYTNTSWHPHVRIIREQKQGLVHARLRGISVSSGALLIFVDDDNDLNPDYLFEALAIARARPEVGAWGGDISGEFETPPSDKCNVFIPSLTIRRVTRATISFAGTDSCPYGAGLCIRRRIAVAWAEAALNCSLRLSLGRSGTSLTGGEDLDMALFAHDAGLATGLFPQLRLKHLIARERLSEDYLFRICVAGTAALHVVRYLHGMTAIPSPLFKARKAFTRHCLYKLGWLSAQQKYSFAMYKAQQMAARTINPST